MFHSIPVITDSKTVKTYATCVGSGSKNLNSVDTKPIAVESQGTDKSEETSEENDILNDDDYIYEDEPNSDDIDSDYDDFIIGVCLVTIQSCLLRNIMT